MDNVIQFIVWLLLCSTTAGTAAVPIDVCLDRIIAPIITHGDDVILAASFEYGTYGADGMSSNECESLFRDLPEETAFEYPEYVVFKTYQYLREGNARALYELWDPEYSRGKFAGGFEEFKKRRAGEAQSTSYGDVRLLAKSRFGPYVRIDHEVEAVIGSGPTILSQSFYYIEQDGRYYQTTEIGRTSLFGVLVDLATQGERKGVDSPLEKGEAEAMQALTAIVDLALPSGKRSANLRYSQTSAASDLADHRLVVYHNIEYIGSATSDWNDPNFLDTHQRFLRNVSRTYESGDEEEILTLWKKEDRSAVRHRIDSLKEDGSWPQRTGSFFKEDTIIHAIEETDRGVIVISENGPHARSALYLVESPEGELKLSRYLGSSGGNRIFLKRGFLEALIEQLQNRR